MPPCSTSSAPHEARITRSPAIGRSRSASATATRTATALRLSFAPGTTGLRAMSASSAVDSAHSAVPAAVRPRRRVAAPAATIAGAPTAPHHCGTEVSIRSITPGNQSTSLRCAVWSKAIPVRAASWWAISTRVRSAVGSPASATTFQVVLRAAIARRAGRRPLDTSSAIKPAISAPPAIPSARRRPPIDARPESAPAAVIAAIRGAKPSRNSSSSTRASAPARVEPARDPLGGLALAVGAGEPLERRQRLDDLAQGLDRRPRLDALGEHGVGSHRRRSLSAGRCALCELRLVRPNAPAVGEGAGRCLAG